jgi:hypothetical protein
MTDNDHYDPNESMVHVVNNIVNKLPDFPAIARDIQNRAKHHVGFGLTKARLFRKFLGTSMRVVELLWSSLSRAIISPTTAAPSI